MKSYIVGDPCNIKKEATGIFDRSLFIFGQVGVSDEDGSG